MFFIYYNISPYKIKSIKDLIEDVRTTQKEALGGKKVVVKEKDEATLISTVR